MGKLLFSLVLAFLTLGTLLTTTALASHNGPVFFVDDDNPESDDTDGDYHFHSIAAVFEQAFPAVGENDRIVVDPGSYEGNILINVKGVVLEAPKGRDLTKFSGQITIAAKDVQVIGFDVDASGQDYGFVVQNDNVLLQANKAHNATEAGIVVEAGSDGVTITDNEVFNNGTEGIHVRDDSDSAAIQSNDARSNGAIGIFISGASDRASISDNNVSLNQSEGIKVQDSDEAQVNANKVFNNALDGIRFEGAKNGRIVENEISSSGGYGIALVDSDNNTVQRNSTTSNDGGGVALRGSERSSKSNVIENNTITGNIRAGSEGVLLEGDVSSNLLQGNTISSNSFGIRFKMTSSGQTPGNNNIEQNNILDSPEDGIEVAGSAGRNRIFNNTLSGNNKVGIRLKNTTGNDSVLNNTIVGNGHQGILVDGSFRNVISANVVQNNGREGISLSNGAGNNNVADNTVQKNLSDGVAVVAGSNGNDVEGNTIKGNRQSGVLVDEAAQLDVRSNTITDNVAEGILIRLSDNIDIEHNVIRDNNKGGIAIEGASTLDIEQNNIESNTQFGMSASPDTSDLKADRNWWGSARGPAGIFEGAGNAVVGLDIEQVFPWLPAEFEYLKLGSTAGEIIDDFGLDDPATFLAMDKADVDVNFFKVNPEEDGMIIVSKYEDGQPQVLSGLDKAIKAIGVLVSGIKSGTTLINVKYDDAEIPAGVNKDTLRLYYYDGAKWVQMEGRSRSNVNIVEGEISVDVLRDGVIIAIAPGGN